MSQGRLNMGQKIKSLRKERKLTQKKLAENIGVGQSYIADLENGKSQPSLKVLKEIARVLDVPVGLLLEEEETINKIAEEFYKVTQFSGGMENLSENEKREILKLTAIHQPDSFYELDDDIRSTINEAISSSPYPTFNLVKIPVMGVIRAGEPMYADQNIIGYEYLPDEIVKGGEYFGLKVTGDSMNLVPILDQQIVVVRKQDIVENGEIAVVIVDGEDATVKRFYHTDTTVTLMPQSSNPDYVPRIIDTMKTEVRVVGKVVKGIISY